MAIGSINRREAAAALLAVPGAIMAARAQPAIAHRATPAQTEGPFYPVRLPADADFDLVHNGSLTYARGQPGWLEGAVLDLDGKPVAGAQVEIWQCDGNGHYHHPGDGSRADPAFQGFGRVQVGSDGSYRFHTIRPVPYTGRTPHIHVKVKLDGRELLTTQLYVEGDPHNERDSLWRQLAPDERSAVTLPFRRSGDGWQATFPIVVRA